MLGMAMLIKVGDPDEFPKPPSWSRTCGGYDYQPDESLESSHEDPQTGMNSEFSSVNILVGAGILMAMLLGGIVVLVRKLYTRRKGYTLLRT